MINRRHVLAVGAAVAVAPTVVRAEGEAAFDAALTTAFEAVKPVALAGGLVTAQGLAWSGVRGVRRAGEDASATTDDRWHL
ncbi:MAG TPA: serine hydrolase, partial [Brevundimonas sp.]|nr:serine hydrolase [Brevundimonas sp.]